MGRKDYLGDEIKDILQDALNTKNFSGLNQGIGRTVNSALRDIENMFSGKPPVYEDPLWKPLSQEEPQGERTYEQEEVYRENSYGGEAFSEKVNPRTYQKKSGDMRISDTPSGRIAGVLLIIFGFLGMGLMALILISYGMTATLTQLNLVNGVTLGTILPLLGLSGIMAAKGIQLRKRVSRFRRYCFKLNGRSYCNIKEFSESMGKSEKFVVKDLQKMIHLCMFPQGRLDDGKTCFMLDEETYKQYINLEKWQKEQKEEEELQKREMAEKQAAAQNEGAAQRELRTTIEEGKGYIAQIRKANDDIPGEEVSIKLDRLETVISKIFHHIEKHPEQILEIRKFMNYYLPTTLKLTNTYKELDNQPIMGENISSAKVEIEKTLDTINLAFENLYDDLFYHTAMDVSSDISVLKTMLAQEGLAEKDFVAKRKMEGKE